MKAHLNTLLLLPFFLFLFTSASAQELLPKDSIRNQSPGMNILKMHAILDKETQIVEGSAGIWQVFYGERMLFIMTDETNNRMRIFTPVVAQEEIKSGELEKMLEANFHSALDAKYSLYEGFVISVYTHPLKELQTLQFIDAMQQVVVLADNYGGSYSSTSLIFGGGGEEEQKEEEKSLNKKPGKKS